MDMQTLGAAIAFAKKQGGSGGAPGAAAGFGTPTATVDNTTGTPSVQVTASGPDTAKIFAFAFSGLKGETGPTGPKGETGATGPQGPAGRDGMAEILELPFSESISVTEEQKNKILSNTPPIIKLKINDDSGILFYCFKRLGNIVVYYSVTSDEHIPFGYYSLVLENLNMTLSPVASYFVPNPVGEVGKIIVVGDSGEYELKSITELISNGDEVSY